MNEYQLTPVEKFGKYSFKREDLYRPFDFSPVNGSKLRQCQILVQKNANYNGFVTGTSIKSPQAPILSAVGKSINKPVTIMYGGTTFDNLKDNKYYQLCLSCGGDVKIVSKMAFTSVLNLKSELYAKEHGLYNVKYGIDLMNNLDVFIDSTANQVQNIGEVDNIVVTVGSSITILGILYGLVIHNIPCKRIYAIGCAPNRVDKINEYSKAIFNEKGVRLPVEKIIYVDAFNLYKGFKYENTVNEEYFGLQFHPRYEAKTFRWLKNNDLIGNTLMWITGSDFD